MDIMPDLDLIDREYAYDGELGALYSQAQTTFRVWSPMAERAVLKLYLSARANTPHSTLEMSRDGGVWEVAVPGDLTWSVLHLRIHHRRHFPGNYRYLRAFRRC